MHEGVGEVRCGLTLYASRVEHGKRTAHSGEDEPTAAVRGVFPERCGAVPCATPSPHGALRSGCGGCEVVARLCVRVRCA